MKLRNKVITGLCLGAVAFCASPNAVAKGKKSPTPEPTASASPNENGAVKTARAIPFRGKISSVDSAAKTFTITYKSGTTRVFKMTERTKILKDGAAAGTADLAADQEVRGSYWKKADGSDGSIEAKSVMLGAKAETGAASGKKKGKTEESSPEPSATP